MLWGCRCRDDIEEIRYCLHTYFVKLSGKFSVLQGRWACRSMYIREIQFVVFRSLPRFIVSFINYFIYLNFKVIIIGFNICWHSSDLYKSKLTVLLGESTVYFIACKLLVRKTWYTNENIILKWYKQKRTINRNNYNRHLQLQDEQNRQFVTTPDFLDHNIHSTNKIKNRLIKPTTLNYQLKPPSKTTDQNPFNHDRMHGVN